jgi:D-3-phosphoglycerate dehydrogenase / 2-oxoglutarate reductase
MPEPARVLLWGPSEHASEADEARLQTRLETLGCSVTRRAKSEPPDSAAMIVVVNTKRSIGARELGAMPKLELALTTTSGYDHLDRAACASRGVRVARCPVARRDAVVETTLAMGLALLRRLPELNRDAAEGRWVRAEVKTRAMPLLRDVTVGVIGHGVIGAHAVTAWRALGATVIACDPAFPDLAPFDDVLTRATIVSLHCSLTTSSDRMFDAATIGRMPRGAILLNTARGECVDETALLAALDSGQLGGAGLDVFATEPPSALAEFTRRRSVFVTPHSAGYFDGLARAVEDEVVATIAAFRDGRPIAEV